METDHERSHTVMTDPHRERIARITAHPEFNRLVREVAIIDCTPSMPRLRWLQRNSRSRGMWAHRQADGSSGLVRTNRRRADALCARIIENLFGPEAPERPRENYWAVWVTARNYAAARVFHHTELESEPRPVGPC